MPINRLSVARRIAALPVAAAVVFACTTQSSAPVEKTSTNGAALNALSLRFEVPIQRGPQPAKKVGAGGCTLKYYGGRVLAPVEVVQVIWGTGVDTNVATKTARNQTELITEALDDLAAKYGEQPRQAKARNTARALRHG